MRRPSCRTLRYAPGERRAPVAEFRVFHSSPRNSPGSPGRFELNDDALKENAQRQQSPSPKSWRTVTLAPFRSRVFLMIWSASLVANFGTLIQAVGASWLMTSLAPSPDMVALVQTSSTLPIMLLSLLAGAVADIWDRRIIMLIAQSAMLVVSVVLAVVTYLGLITPWTLLTLTFLLGCGMALHGPAWQSSVGEQVPRADLPAAIALNTLSFNTARTVGPAIGGVVVAVSGPPAAFLLNALSYIALIVALAMWRRPKQPVFLPPESIGRAIGAGLRYARLSPSIRTVLVRAAVFGMLGSSIWALMPLIARDLIGGGAFTYGVLFGAFGLGAVVGALANAHLRLRYRNETVVRVASVAFGLATMAAAFSSWLVVTMGALFVGGAAWVLALSTFNITVQISSPRWVVGRAMAIYQMVAFGGLAVGSWLWGEIGEQHGLVASLVASGIVMGASASLGRKLPLTHADGVNLEPLREWQELQRQIDRVPEGYPVVVTIEYRVAPQDQDGFLDAMREVRRIRRRDGARRWTLVQDIDNPEIWIERFQSPTWTEHLRRRHRFTIADRDIVQRAYAFHRGPEGPKVRHLLERDPDQASGAGKAAATQLGERAAATDPNLPATSLSLDTSRERER